MQSVCSYARVFISSELQTRYCCDMDRDAEARGGHHCTLGHGDNIEIINLTCQFNNLIREINLMIWLMILTTIDDVVE